MQSSSPPNHSQQPNQQEARIRKQVKRILLFRVLLLSFLLGINSLLRTANPSYELPPEYIIFSFIIAIFIFSIISAAFTNKLTKYKTFTYLQLLADATLTAVIVYYSGGSRSIFTFVFFFPLICGGLLFFLRGALIVSSYTLICYGFILSTESMQLAYHFPSLLGRNLASNSNILLQIFSVYGLAFFLVSILSATLAGRLHKTEKALSAKSQDLDALSILYKQIFDDISSGIITLDSEGVITSFNRASEEITGYTAHEIIGRTAEEIFPGFTAPADQHQRPLMTLLRKDTEKVPIGYSWAKLHVPGGQGDYRVYTLQDLSKIKQMEAMLKQSEKMAAIGQIAAGIAHEFRNPLAAISGAAQVLNSSVDPNQTSKSLLKIITRECSRLENNISDFLQFSKPAQPEKTWLSLERQVNESWAVISQAGATPELELDIPTNLDCWADQHQLKQVLINLIHNAAMACDTTRGQVRVRAYEETIADLPVCIVIEITDTGCGITADKMPKIFEPFYTTKENGTGLGLAIVKQIVDGHNGTIDCASDEHGTRFTVKFPLPEAM